MKNKKNTIAVALLVMGIILVTTGVTYSYFTYTQTGTTYSTITADSITFHYEEKNGKGAGINITNAFPVADNEAARSTGDSFNFKITSKTPSNKEIPYTVTARMTSNSDIVMGEAIDLYLTEVNDGVETPTAIFIDKEHRYSSLGQYEPEKVYTEKIILTTKVPKNTSNYEKNYRLRMWMDASINLDEKTCTISPDENNTEEKCATANGEWVYKYNDKSFSVTFNVYSTAQDPAPETNDFTRIAFDGRPLKPEDSNEMEDDYYWILIPSYSQFTGYYKNTYTPYYGDEPNNLDLEVTTQYNNSTVEIIETDHSWNPIAAAFDSETSPKIQRIASSNTYKINLNLVKDGSDYDYSYNCIINLRSKDDPTKILKSVKVDIDSATYSWFYNDDDNDGVYTPWATWFLNEGRDTYCNDTSKYPCYSN